MPASDVAPSVAARSSAVRVAAVVLVVVIALVVPPVLVVNALRVLATDTFVRFEYDRDGFPADRYGLTRDQREALALTGLDSIQPGSDGIVLLERATLPDGTQAFDARELAHMEDVRTLFGAALRAQLVTVLVVVVLALVLGRTRLRVVVPRGLLAGALATLAIAVLAVPFILLGFDRFFTRFHEMFFEGDSWRFSSTDTLIRLYPERFWEDVSQLAAAITVAQAVVLALVAWWWLRAARRRAA
jgi:integral membrane protein (TIGR01906 family)